MIAKGLIEAIRPAAGTSAGSGTAGTGSDGRMAGASTETRTYRIKGWNNETGACNTDHCGREIRYRLTRKGFDLANSVFVEFI